MMLGIGEVWYFRWKIGVFSGNENSIMVPVQNHLYVQSLTLLQLEGEGGLGSNGRDNENMVSKFRVIRRSQNEDVGNYL